MPLTSPSPSRAAARFAAAALALAMLLPGTSDAQRFSSLRDRGALDDGGRGDVRSSRAPEGTREIADVAYGADPSQRFDVYLPATPVSATAPMPVIFFVHGGGWAFGDKAMRRVVEPKVAHWVAQGWVVVSANTRLLPTPVAQQADDVAAAIAVAQSQAASWGADANRFVLMGHSAGAHLVALVAAGAKTPAHPKPWRGAVLLDSAVLDLPLLMAHRHLGLYDNAFGTDPAQWPALSPYAALGTRPDSDAIPAPFLEVCSSRRAESCPQADRFAARAQSLGGQARVLREDLSHGEINATLGAPSDYTSQVDAFLQSLR